MTRRARLPKASTGPTKSHLVRQCPETRTPNKPRKAEALRASDRIAPAEAAAPSPDPLFDADDIADPFAANALWERAVEDRENAALRQEILETERRLWDDLEQERTTARTAPVAPTPSRAPVAPSARARSLPTFAALPLVDPAARERAAATVRARLDKGVRSLAGASRARAARLFWLGRTHELISDDQAALQYFRRAAALAPSDPTTWRGIARVAGELGDREAAHGAWLRVAALSPPLLGPARPEHEQRMAWTQLAADTALTSPRRSLLEPPRAPRLRRSLSEVILDSPLGQAWEASSDIARRRAWILGAFALVALIAARSLRQTGDVAIHVVYPSELQGMFRVRLYRRASAAAKAAPQSDEVILRGGVSNRREHFSVSRETRFGGLGIRSYHVVLDGVLQDPSSGTTLFHPFVRQTIEVKPRRTIRVDLDARPPGCPVEIRVAWHGRPSEDAHVAVRGEQPELHPTPGGKIDLWLQRGHHVIAAGAGDRVCEAILDIDSFLPHELSFDLADGGEPVFKACPPAVRPYLEGDHEHAAIALERDGQTRTAHMLRARDAHERGEYERAAEHFELAGDWIEAAELHSENGEYGRAGELFARAGDPLAAGEMFELAGDETRAGEAFERARDFERAIACYQRSGDIGKWVDTLERRGEPYAAAVVALDGGLRARGTRLLQRVAPEDPHFAEACGRLTDVFEEEGHWDLAATKLGEQIFANRPDDPSPEVRSRHASLHERAGNIEFALEALEELRLADPSYPGVAARIEELRKARSSKRVAAARFASEAGGLAPTILLADQRYEMLEEIGRGGMGVVFRARDLRLGRTVALKRLSENLRDYPAAVSLFFREAQSAAALNHPNIVTLYDADQEDGTLFITMELLEGQPLHTLLRQRGRIEPAELARMGIQVAAGLEYAHARRVVHRDIKTANLFLTKDNVVKITDFGLAKVLEEVKRSASVIGGTPYYMAPEQAAGEVADHRADLYSLGITLFELATGRLPFTDGDVAYHNRHTQPPDPRSIAGELPDALAELILKMLSKAPAERPASAAAVGQALEAIRSELA